jgi:hypothetical protein
MSRPIWVYWENPIGQDYTPKYIELCLRTMDRAAGPDTLHVLDAASASRVATSLPPWWSQLEVLAHKADILKAHLLYLHGGLAIDADTIALRDFSFIFEELERGADFLGFGPEGDPSIGVLAAKPGSRTARDWILNQLAAFERGGISWETFGSQSLAPAVALHGCTILPWRLTHPILWYEWNRFLSDENVEAFADGSYSLVSLFNQMIGPTIARFSEDQLLNSPTLLSQLFRVALGSRDLAGACREQVANGPNRIER